MTITLSKLPYDKDGLAPYISSNTLDFHLLIISSIGISLMRAFRRCSKSTA
nr:hypothetical protein [Desulfobulbaceae bacterium]